MNLKRLQISLIIFGFFFPILSFGQAFQVNFQGQKQQGMGLAGSALFLDASSLFYNPGAVAFSNENSANVGITPIFANILFVDSTTSKGYRTNNPMGTPFQAFGLFQLKDSSALKLGLAIYTPFGSTVQWEDNWIGRFALTRLSLSSIFIQPTVSYRINDRLGIGGGIISSIGGVTLQRDLPLQFENGNYGNVELSGRAFGMGFNLGIQFKANEYLSIGLNYRSRINMKVNNGNAQFNVPSSLESNFPNGKFTSSLPLPQVATLGIAYAFNDKLTAVVDVNFVGWQAYDTLAFDYEINTPSLQDTKSARDYKNIFAFRGGAAYKITDAFTMRAGGGYGFTPVQAGYATPETPDANRLYATLGLGYQIADKLTLDASLFYTHIQRAETNLETNLSGTFFTKAVAPGISIIYKW